jgi:hypothetical protein
VSPDGGPPPLELARLFEALDEERVEYVVIGGIARVAIGSHRFTKDLDICPAGGRDNLDRLAKALNPLNPKIRTSHDDADGVPVTLDGVLIERTQSMLLTTDAGWIDLLQEPDGSGGYMGLRPEAERVEYEGHRFDVAAIEDQIAMKLAAGRQQDLADVEVLRAIKRRREQS